MNDDEDGEAPEASAGDHEAVFPNRDDDGDDGDIAGFISNHDLEIRKLCCFLYKLLSLFNFSVWEEFVTFYF